MSYLLVGSLNARGFRVEGDRITADALKQAKEALIAYAVTDPNRPGELPCPDVNDDGKLIMNEDYVGNNCVSLVGRLPWLTLGLPDLRDDSGERLWYALSKDFRANGSVSLNSNTAYRNGNESLSITGTQSATNVIAIVLAAGAPVKRLGEARLQDRSCPAGQCDSAGKCMSSPPVSIPKCNPANYLDISGAVDNAAAGTDFVSAHRDGSFNDRLLPLHSDEVMWLVERRAGRELSDKLHSHFNAWRDAAVENTTFTNFKGFYPWAAPFADPSIPRSGTNGTRYGLLPFDPAAVIWQSASATDGACTGVGTALVDCLGILSSPDVVHINARVSNVATAFVDPPKASDVTIMAGFPLTSSRTWTLNTSAQVLDFSMSSQGVVSGVYWVRLRAPSASAWTTSSWLKSNRWYELTYYALSGQYGLSGSGTCSGAECVHVAGVEAHAVVVMMGRQLPSQPARPVTNATPGDFLERSNATPDNLIFETSVKSTTFNDLPLAIRP